MQMEITKAIGIVEGLLAETLCDNCRLYNKCDPYHPICTDACKSIKKALGMTEERYDEE